MTTPNIEIKKELDRIIHSIYSIDNFDYSIVLQTNKKFGDYSTNLPFLLSKKIGGSVLEISKKIKSELDSIQIDLIRKTEIANEGFLNFFANKDTIINLFKYSNILKFNSTKNKIIIDYSSPNIAKPMHAGNLRTTLLGDFLYRLYSFAGYKVIRWNHIGDWGTQFGKLIVAYKLWGDDDKIKQNPIEELLSLYIKFHEKAKTDSDMEDRAREEFMKLEKGDKKNIKLLNWFRKESIKELDLLYKKLDIQFDVTKGESFYIKLSKKIISLFIKLGIAQKSDGAIIINLSEYGLPPALIEKADGSTLYLTRDIATLKYRKNKYNPNKIFYIVGREQILHFEQLKAVIKKWNEYLKNSQKIPDFKHIWSGLVLGQDSKKLSTRSGKIITAKDIINNFIETSKKISLEKNIKSYNKNTDELSEIIGIGALKYGMLKNNRISNIKLDSSKEITLKGNSSLYIQYTRARLMSIINKTKMEIKNEKINTKYIDDDEFEIIKQILNFKNIIEKTIQESSAHILAEFLFSLSNKINAFYEKKLILKANEEKIKYNRLIIIDITEKILKTGLNIMGIKSPNSI